MLYETAFQPKIALYFIVSGILSGVFFDIKKISLFFIHKKIFVEHFFTFFAWIFTLFTFYYSNLIINFGEFRLYCVIVFAFSVLFERLIATKLLAKHVAKCYNKFRFRKNGKSDERKEKI